MNCDQNQSQKVSWWQESCILSVLTEPCLGVEVLRKFSDPKLHIVSLELFCEKCWKKVSSINYIDFSLGEPWVSGRFLGIFLHLRKSWFLEPPKVLRAVKLYHRRHESQVFILLWFLWFNKSSFVQTGSENLTYYSWRTSENFGAEKVCFLRVHVVSSSEIQYFKLIIFRNSSFQVGFH